MISLTIDRTSLGLLPYTITDTGTSGPVLVAFQPGAIQRENAIATSRWIDGGALVSTRTEMTALSLTVRLWSTSYAQLRTDADTLGDALGQYSYTITETPTTGAARVYTCMPASWQMEMNPADLQKFTALFTASVPRQP